MIGFSTCNFSSVDIVDKETGKKFKIDGIKDATLEMEWSAEVEAPMFVKCNPMQASFNAKTTWNEDMLNKLLYNPQPVHKSPEFEMMIDGRVQVRRHRKKRINKKWAKRYGYKNGLVSNGRWRLAECDTRDGEFVFEKVW